MPSRSTWLVLALAWGSPMGGAFACTNDEGAGTRMAAQTEATDRTAQSTGGGPPSTGGAPTANDDDVSASLGGAMGGRTGPDTPSGGDGSSPSDDDVASDDDTSADDDVASDDDTSADDDVASDDDVSADDDAASDDDASMDDDVPVGGAGPEPSSDAGRPGGTGGTAGAPQGGAAGSAGAGGGGAGGTSPEPAGCGSNVVDDFSTCDANICSQEGRQGAWYDFAGAGISLDPSLRGVLVPPSGWGDRTCSAMIAGGASGAGTTYFAGVGFPLNDYQAYDLSQFAGVRFVIESDQLVDFTVRTIDDEYFTNGSAAGETGGDSIRFTVPFDTLVARGDTLAVNPNAVFDASRARDFQWLVRSPEAGFALAVHGIVLY